jgi:hypothetical protein
MKRETGMSARLNASLLPYREVFAGRDVLAPEAASAALRVP